MPCCGVLCNLLVTAYLVPNLKSQVLARMAFMDRLILCTERLPSNGMAGRRRSGATCAATVDYPVLAGYSPPAIGWQFRYGSASIRVRMEQRVNTARLRAPLGSLLGEVEALPSSELTPDSLRCPGCALAVPGRGWGRGGPPAPRALSPGLCGSAADWPPSSRQEQPAARPAVPPADAPLPHPQAASTRPSFAPFVLPLPVARRHCHRSTRRPCSAHRRRIAPPIPEAYAGRRARGMAGVLCHFPGSWRKAWGLAPARRLKVLLRWNWSL